MGEVIGGGARESSFFITQFDRAVARGCFAVTFEQDLLGCYDTASAALTAPVAGETQKPRCGLDIQRLALPQSVMSWAFYPETDDADRPLSLRRALARQAALAKREGGSSEQPEQAPHPEAAP